MKQHKSIATIAVIIPNLNGVNSLDSCISSLQSQSLSCTIVVVENASEDGSAQLLADHFPEVTVLQQDVNHGFAGGVNIGLRWAIDHGFTYAALFNNDAIADSKWLEEMTFIMNPNDTIGIVAPLLLSKNVIDSFGEGYSVWGLPYPMHRGQQKNEVVTYKPLGATGGASLYRVAALKEIGLFDEDFFAYYEDVDISFRAQLAGWSVALAKEAIVYHETGQTGGSIKGFYTLQTIKNLPWLLIKNVPRRHLLTILPRFFLAYTLFIVSAIARGHIKYAAQGLVLAISKSLKKLRARRHIQTSRKVGDDYIWNLMTHDLPPNAHKLRKLRSLFWNLNKKRT